MGAEERRALARSIYEQSREMSELVTNVLEMTRLEAGGIALDRDWHALGEIAGSVLRRLRERLAAHPVRVELPPDLPLVRVDATLIEQVLANLLENAAKYTPPGTTVTLRAGARDGELVVSVEDPGPGLPAGRPGAAVRQVPPRQGRRARSAARASASPSAARSCACTAGASGRSGAPQGGAAFRFTLPLEPAPPMPAGTRMTRAARRPCSSSRTSPRSGASCAPRSAPKATAWSKPKPASAASIDAGTHKPDLAIVDLGLPDMDGVEVIRRIRAWSPMPIIVLSARAREQAKVDALDAGADDYVTKPFGVGELLARMRVALRHAARAGRPARPCCVWATWRSTSSAGGSLATGRRCTSRRSSSGCSRASPSTSAWSSRTASCCARSGGRRTSSTRHYLRIYMKQLRDKLEDDPVRPRHFITETGVGYRLVPEDGT